MSKIKEKLGVRDIPFAVSQNICDEFRELINNRCGKLVEKFEENLNKLTEEELKENEQINENDSIEDELSNEEVEKMLIVKWINPIIDGIKSISNTTIDDSAKGLDSCPSGSGEQIIQMIKAY